MPATPVALFGALTTWLTPVWLLSLGAALGMAVLLLLLGLLWLVARQKARQVPATIRESILLPITYLVLVLVGIALAASYAMPAQRVLASLGRVWAVGPITRQVTVPPRTVDHQVDVPTFRAEELKQYSMESDQDLYLAAEPGGAEKTAVLEIPGGEPARWNFRSGQAVPLSGQIAQLYITNESDSPATLSLYLVTDVEFPEVYIIPATATSLVGLYLVYFLINWSFPKLSVIALATAKEAISQPLFYVVLAIGAFLLLVFIYVPYNTFGEDVKMLKDSGLTLILVLSIVVALWTASVSIADEIEGRTALTLLSKPIGRRQFILGKFLGIIWPIVLLFILLGTLFLVTVSYKVVYDARETSNPEPSWQECHLEMVQTVPGLALAFMETVVLASISVAISTRMTMLPNLLICSSIYVLGHLGPMIVQSAAGRFEIVAFVGQLIALLLPVLDHFNIQAAVAAGAEVPPEYLGWTLLYCVLYSTIAMLLALAMFEDRDLA